MTTGQYGEGLLDRRSSGRLEAEQLSDNELELLGVARWK